MERNPVTVTASRAGSTDSSDQEDKKSLASAADYMRNFKNIIAPGNEASMTREFNPQVDRNTAMISHQTTTAHEQLGRECP